MKITSLVSRFSGLVTFNDNTSGTFHTQSENNQVWSVDEAESTESLKQVSWFEPTAHVWPYWSAIGNAITKLPFLNFQWDTPYPVVQKTITDMVARLDIIMTRDDNQTYSVAVIIEGVNDDIRVELPDLATGATNLAAIKTELRAMFKKVMATVTLT